MKYFKFCWMLVIVLFICSEDILAAPNRQAKPKPKYNYNNIHHNNINRLACG